LKRSGSPEWKCTSDTERLADHLKVVLIHLLAEELRNQRLQDILADLAGELVADQIDAGALPGRNPGSLTCF
jgi:hypothetical protein